MGDPPRRRHRRKPRRMIDGLDWMWRFVPELFEMDEVAAADRGARHRRRSGRIPRRLSGAHRQRDRRSDARAAQGPAPDPRRPPRPPQRASRPSALRPCSSCRAPIRTRHGSGGAQCRMKRPASGRCWKACRIRKFRRVGGRSRHRARRERGRVVITPTYTGCPATQVIERDIRAALDAAGYRDVADRDRARAALDHRLDQRGGQGASCAPTASRRRARRRHAGRMPAMRLDRDRRDQPLRLDAVQGAVALPRLPGAVRPVQMPLRCRPASTLLKVAEVVPETAEAMSIRFDVPEELRETFRFKPGQHLTLRDRDRRRRSAPQLFALRRARRTTS